MKNILIVGAGIAGATAANLLAKNYKITVIEQNSYLGGACADIKNIKHNCYVHLNGPHIFHTTNDNVWQYVNRFSKFYEYQHKVFTYVDNKYYSFPINLNVLSDLFNTKIYSKEHAMSLINPTSYTNPKNFEEAALNSIGKTIYEKFVKNYTEKQWKTSCVNLPPDIFKRVDIRFNYNDGYFANQFQGMPTDGYSKMIENMLSDKNITIIYNTSLNNFDTSKYDILIYTGGFDDLPYRSTHFEFIEKEPNIYSVVNTPQHPTETRYTNFSVLHPINGIPSNNKHLYCHETPLNINEENQLYPIINKENLDLYNKKVKEFMAKYNNKNIILLGRLATYQYLDMDKVIEQVFNGVKNI